jgi:hypothetical protein
MFNMRLIFSYRGGRLYRPLSAGSVIRGGNITMAGINGTGKALELEINNIISVINAGN